MLSGHNTCKDLHTGTSALDHRQESRHIEPTETRDVNVSYLSNGRSVASPYVFLHILTISASSYAHLRLVGAGNLCRARTRAEHLTWASTLGPRALPPRLSAHGPAVWLADAPRPQGCYQERGNLWCSGMRSRSCAASSPARNQTELTVQ